MSLYTMARRWLATNSSRVYLERFLQQAARQLPAGSCVLDAGAGDCRYAALFQHTNYIAVDFAKVAKPYGELDVIADLVHLPFPSAYFDAIDAGQKASISIFPARSHNVQRSQTRLTRLGQGPNVLDSNILRRLLAGNPAHVQKK